MITEKGQLELAVTLFLRNFEYDVFDTILAINKMGKDLEIERPLIDYMLFYLGTICAKASQSAAMKDLLKIKKHNLN
jgi:hypothetical protein